MNRTNEALLKRLKYINDTQYRPACYKDFEEFEVDGKLYKLERSTLRNKFSVLKNGGYIERYYNSRASFFVLKGIKFGRQRTQHATTEHSISQLSEAIQVLPKESKGLHDIHTSFQVLDIWQILSESKRFKVNEHNKGILLPPFNIDGLKIIANIHHTDTVTVTVACSKNPISAEIDNVDGVIRLAAALARTQERIQRIVDECEKLLPGGYESIIIPDSNTWMVKMWHFGVDSKNYKELETCLTWKDAHGVLLRKYHKKKEGKLKRERQEYPNLSFCEVRRMTNDSRSETEPRVRSVDSDKEKKDIRCPSLVGAQKTLG
ncbi:MAG: hypothetical protein WBX01_13205 [Nitrososphaeraceae archaeon]